ncbi:Down syndrome cell adhesion molecule-like protein Dscam2 [Nymphon striatum]|nr:Down syndrome cell adhesion molecule-like protein Dscam2 [Nymphon striatum]
MYPTLDFTVITLNRRGSEYVLLLFSVLRLNCEDLSSVKQGPVFIYTPPGHLSFLNSKGLVMDCLAHGFPEPKIQWLNNKGEEVSSIPYIRKIASNGSMLLLPFDGKEYQQEVHATKYRCSASNKHGRIVSTLVNVRAVVRQDYQAQVYDEYIEEKNTAVLKCQVPSYVTDDVFVTAWIRDDDVVISQMDSFGGKYTMFADGALHITNVKMSDSNQLFRCQTKHKVLAESKVSRSYGKVVVSRSASTIPPRMVHTIPEITVSEGSDIKIPCVFHGSPVPSYRWSIETADKKSKPLESNDRFVQISGSLMISNALTSDSGRYVCEASNSIGTDKAVTTLSVTAHLTVYISPQAQVIDGGQFAKFNCSVYGSPVKSVLWRKNGLDISFGEEEGISLKNEKNIVIEAVQHSHEAMYQCFASNELEEAQGTAQLILGKSIPRLLETFDDELLQSGPSLTLTCVAVGNPQPVFHWTLDNIPIIEFSNILQQQEHDIQDRVISRLFINSMRSEDGGLYNCTATNMAGSAFHSARISVYGVPFVRNLRNMSVVSGSDAFLHCYHGGYPISNIIWMKDGVDVMNDEKYTVFRNGTLKISKSTKKQDNGEFVCKVANSQGQYATGKMWLTVMLKPDLEPMTDRSVSEGRSVRITCTLSDGDKPVKLEWIKDGNPVDLHLGITVKEHDFISLLTIQHVHSIHDGNYTCLATNEAGSVNQTVSVKVEVPPSWKTKPKNVEASKNSNVYAHCEVKGHPRPTTTWYRSVDGGKVLLKSLDEKIIIFSNGTLVLKNPKKVDSGKYACTSTNGIGNELKKTITILIGDVPDVSISTEDTSLNAGQSAKFICKVSGSDVRSEWQLDNLPLEQKLPRNTYQEKISNYAGNLISELSIGYVQSDYSGYYSCIGTNSFGKNTSNIFIKIRGVPSQPTDVKVTQITQKAVRISWKVSRTIFNPIKYFIIQYRSDKQDEITQKSTNDFMTSAFLHIEDEELTYFVSVAAVNDFGQSNPSHIVSFYFSENGTLMYNKMLKANVGGGIREADGDLQLPVYIIIIVVSISLLVILAIIVCVRMAVASRSARSDNLKNYDRKEESAKSLMTSEYMQKQKSVDEDRRSAYGVVGIHESRSERNSRYVSTELHPTPSSIDYYSEVSPYATFSLADSDKRNQIELKTFSPRSSAEIRTEL